MSDITMTSGGYSHPWLSWRSVLAGLLVALFAYVTLLSLGVGIGGVTLAETEDLSAASAGIASGLWIVVTAALSLFVGSYFASRISRFNTERIGAAQSAVITSLFFGLLLMQLGSSLGSAGRALGTVMGSAGRNIASGMTDLASNPQVQDVIESAVSDLNLRSAPEVVIRGVALRLVRGDTISARDYLAHQANMSSAEAQNRIDQVRNQVQNAVGAAGQKAARAMSAAGWSLFVTMVIGMAAAIAGGGLGSRVNLRKPLSREDYGHFSTMSAAPV